MGETAEAKKEQTDLGTGRIPRLMREFAIPSIIAMVIGAVYNIVDQLFIGNAVGTLGNAATNVAFPLTTSCVALSLLFGIGGAACFNLDMGRGEKERALHYIGVSALMLIISGIAIAVVTEIFLTPLLIAFGSPDDVLPYAQEYVRITAIGFPFLVLVTGGGHLIRADGSPKMTMACSLVGAIINVILDALFVMVFGWGMAGAATATIIGQIISGIMVLWYLAHFKTAKLEREHFRLRGKYVRSVAAVGMASCFNQLAMMVVQIVVNNSLTIYGAQSVYGEAIPLATSGIIMKINQIFMSVIIGLAQGAQPIESFNYGAKQYQRVRETFRFAFIVGEVISVCAFLVFMIFPRQILLLFGDNTELYFEFGVMFFRYFLLMTWIIALQPLAANFFSAIGKPKKGAFLSLTRQIIFFLPLVIILPRFFGIMGILYTAPIADGLSCVVAALMLNQEMRLMRKEEARLQGNGHPIGRQNKY